MGTIRALRNDILKPGGYASVPHCVLESSMLEPSDKLVYQILLDHLGNNNIAWPSQATVARRMALSIRGVRRSVARLIEVGLISCEVIAGTSNHYTFSIPEAVLNTETEADSVSDLSQLGGGHAVCTNPATLSHEPLHLTTSPKPHQGTTSVEPPHSPASGGPQPAAAESETDTQPDLLQGVRDMNTAVDSYRSLLTAWTQQKRSSPSPDKITVCLNLLKIQQEKTGEILDPAVVLAAVQDSPPPHCSPGCERLPSTQPTFSCMSYEAVISELRSIAGVSAWRPNPVGHKVLAGSRQLSIAACCNRGNEVEELRRRGYERIIDELKKLRIYSVSRTTVSRILQENSFDLGPKHGRGSWHSFIQMHI
jgi:predicted transcriptional regulator